MPSSPPTYTYPTLPRGRRNAISIPHGHSLADFYRELDSQDQEPAPLWTICPAKMSMQQEEQQATAGAEAPDGWYGE
jgi:hypothetical protein